MTTFEEVKETATDWLNGLAAGFCDEDRRACATPGQMLD
jgi:hypothetical protein